MAEASSDGRARDDVSLTDVALFLNRHKWLIVGSGVAAGVLTLAFLLLLVPQTYKASATVVVVPSKFSSELKPQTLTIQGYQNLLESDAAVAETKRKLVEAGDIDSSTDLRVGRNLQTRIFVSRRSEETELAPMIQIDAEFQSPTVAAKVANTWAEVFLERTHTLMSGTTSATVEFIDQQYPQAKQELESLEQQRVETEGAFQKRRNDVETSWDVKIGQVRSENSEDVAAYQAETRRLSEAFSGEHTLDTRTAQVNALRNAYRDLQDEQARVESALDQKKLELEAARKQLEVTPQFITLHKAITDDALWEAVAASPKKENADLDELRGKTLTTQEMNPVFTDLSSKAANIEMDLNALVPRAKQLSTRLVAMAQELQHLDTALRTDNAAYEKLQREREAGLENLQNEGNLQVSILERRKQQELDGIDRERASRVDQLTRSIDQQQQLFAQLAQNYNEATLAKADQNVEDVRLAADAVPPDHAEGRRLVMKTVLAAGLGLLVGLMLALALEAWSTARP